MPPAGPKALGAGIFGEAVQAGAGVYDIYSSFQETDARQANYARVSGGLKIASAVAGYAALGTGGTIVGIPAGVALGVASGGLAVAAWIIDEFYR